MVTSRRKFNRLIPAVLFGAVATFSGCNSRENSEPDPEIRPGNPKDEADYILSCQDNNPGSEIYGAINNVYPGDGYTWIVPRENALAAIALQEAFRLTGTALYYQSATNTANFLTRIQQDDGAWCDRYSGLNPKEISKSPTQTAETMIALWRVGSIETHYNSLVGGAEYLIACQSVENKGGSDDGLICGGKSGNGKYHSTRWTQDNAFAYRALLYAADWATRSSEVEVAQKYLEAANKILNGINKYCKNPATGAWHRRVDSNSQPVAGDYTDWGCYSPVMIGVPAQYNVVEVASFIYDTFVLKRDDPNDPLNWAVIQNTGEEGRNRVSPGFAFQAAIALTNLGNVSIATQLVHWADQSNLWCNSCNPNGGWIDWRSIDGQKQAPEWQRFIDTSFYSLIAHRLQKFAL